MMESTLIMFALRRILAAGGDMNGEALAETALSDVDGERGRLVVAGHDVEQLAARRGFEEVCALLWDGELPDERARAELKRALGEARVRAHAQLPRLGARSQGRDGRAARRLFAPGDRE